MGQLLGRLFPPYLETLSRLNSRMYKHLNTSVGCNYRFYILEMVPTSYLIKIKEGLFIGCEQPL